ncbi:MAG: xanthine dehydrogenase accessory protein XdhC [Alphaproteobacteria bacterium]
MSMHEDMGWLDDMAACRDAGQAHVLVTVLSVEGSAPRDVGTKMVVTGDRSLGTIGGGALEYEAISVARELLEQATANRIEQRSYPLGPRLRQCCGGKVELLLEAFVTPRRKLFLYGAGHVGREVARLVSRLPVDLIWCDQRGSAEFPSNADKLATRLALDPVAEVAQAGARDFHLIMTHDHDLDFDITSAVLQQPFGWAGLIASASKRARFVKRLKGIGIDQDSLDRLVCPIGLPDIAGKQPAVIALSVTAQMMQMGLHDAG